MHKIHDKFLSSNLVGNVLRFLVFISFMIVTFGQSEIFQHRNRSLTLFNVRQYIHNFMHNNYIYIYIYIFTGVYI